MRTVAQNETQTPTDYYPGPLAKRILEYDRVLSTKIHIRYDVYNARLFSRCVLQLHLLLPLLPHLNHRRAFPPERHRVRNKTTTVRARVSSGRCGGARPTSKAVRLHRAALSVVTFIAEVRCYLRRERRKHRIRTTYMYTITCTVLAELIACALKTVPD